MRLAAATRKGWFLLVFVVVVIGYPITALIGRRRDRDSTGSAALNVVFLMGVVWIFASGQFM